MDNTQLLKRIEALEKQIESLNQSSTITFQVDNSFQQRGFVKTLPIGTPYTGYDTNQGFVRTISLTGAAEDITVPAYPVGWLQLLNQTGGTFWIPLYTFSELAP